MDNKNTKAIDKIIAYYAMQDFERMNKLPNGKYRKKYIPYALSGDTNEARQIKIDYLNGDITEEEYKAFCLRFNLRKENWIWIVK